MLARAHHEPNHSNKSNHMCVATYTLHMNDVKRLSINQGRQQEGTVYMQGYPISKSAHM